MLRNVPQLPAGRRAKWLYVLVWVALFAALGPFAGALSDEQRNDPQAYAPGDAESSRVRELLTAARDGSAMPAVVVYTRPGGLTAGDRAAVAADRAAFEPIAPGRVGEPVPSADGQASRVTVALDGADASAAYDATVQIRGIVRDGPPSGLQALVTGPAGSMVDGADAFLDLDLTSLLVTLGVVATLLLFIYRSPLLWVLPLVAVVVSAGTAQAAVYFLVRAFDLTINGLSQGILTALIFGAGTDYALLITSRYREELARDPDRHAAMALTLRRCTPTLLASAATVVTGMLCLLPATVNTNRSIGPIGATGAAVTLLVMLTFYPALLVTFGRWVFWPRIPAVGSGAAVHHRGWLRVAATIGRRPRLMWAATALVLLALCAALPSVRTGVPAEELYTNTPESTVGLQVLTRHFPAGSGAPADIVAAPTTAAAVTEAAAGTPGVASVQPATPADDRVHIRVVLADPPESTAAESTIIRLRDAVHAVPGAGAMVGGTTATTIDTDAASTYDRTIVIPAVLAAVLLILVLLLRAIVAPLLLLGTVVLSFAAAVGAGWLLFDLVLGLPGLDNQAVLLAFVFLVALGVDYNVFLVSRAREEVQTAGHHEGIRRALVATGGVITSAGIVLAATFTILGLIPVVLAVELGLLVTIGVLLDTFIVRSVLVPALLLDIGPRSWWPRRHSPDPP